MWPEEVIEYFGNGDEMHMNFHFPLMPRLFMALAKGDRKPIEDILARTPKLPEFCQWGTFLRCHDELTLEMVTLEERHWMWETYSPDPKQRINLGIRRRLAPLLDNDLQKNLLMIPCCSHDRLPFLYYGDALAWVRHSCLTQRSAHAMQWDRNPAQVFRKREKKIGCAGITESVWLSASERKAQEAEPGPCSSVTPHDTVRKQYRCLAGRF